LFYGGSQAPEEPKKPQPTESEVADAIRKYPREKCIELFRRASNIPGQSSSELNPEEYQVAKLAAQVFGIVGADPKKPVVRFTYATGRDRAAKRAAEKAEKARTAKDGSGLGENGLPPGVEHSSDGIGLSVIDPVAFQAWKDAKDERESDRAVIAAALEEVA